MGFFNRIKAVADSIAHTTINIRKNVEKALNITPKPSEPLSFGFKYETSYGAGKYDAKLAIIFNQVMRRELLEYMGEQALDAVRDALEPISRTGTLRDSFNYEVTGNNTVVIGSNAPQAGSIATGIATVPSIENLMDWMLTKAEFSGLNEKERHNIAGGIQRNIASGKSPGGKSTLRRLNPTGERAYDYFAVAMKDIEEVINTDIIPSLERI